MKKLVCEMCGNTDLIKQDGYFICQYCGAKYSVEEAKKMMIEGTVDVSGSTVKMDNSAFVEKFLANARRARQKEDWEEVEKYYNLVEQNDPTNIEAIFYSSYGKAMLSMIDDNFFKREQICNAFCKSISVIDDYYPIEKSAENQELVIQMNADLFKMYNCAFVYKQRVQSTGLITDDKIKTYSLFSSMATQFVESLENIIKKDDQLIYWKLIYQQCKYFAENKIFSYSLRTNFRNEAYSVGNYIHEKDPNFNIDKIDITFPKTSSGGCYVATCVYGSYDCPQVWTLRRYRDNTLAKTWYGRAFIHTYYAVSPTIVKWFGKTKWFKKMWKGKLDKMVKSLQEKGVESTPYLDKKW